MRRQFNPQPAGRDRLGPRFSWFGAWRRLSTRASLFAGLVLAAAVFVADPTAAFATEGAPMDFQVKAAFLVNFPKYVDWPAGAFGDTNSPITVAIFGDDNVANEFENMISGGRTVSGHPIVLKRITKAEQIGSDCQILYIGASERSRVPAILEKIKGTAILTVGEGDDFLEQGGIINLVHRDRKIRLQINLSAATQAQLKISSRLLVAADILKGKSG